MMCPEDFDDFFVFLLLKVNLSCMYPHWYFHWGCIAACADHRYKCVAKHLRRTESDMQIRFCKVCTEFSHSATSLDVDTQLCSAKQALSQHTNTPKSSCPVCTKRWLETNLNSINNQNTRYKHGNKIKKSRKYDISTKLFLYVYNMLEPKILQ